MIISKDIVSLVIASLLQANVGFCTTLTIQGDSYKSTCSSFEWERLRIQINTAAVGVESQQLTYLIHNALCGTGPKADEAVRQASTSPVILTTKGTGDDMPTVTRIPRSKLSTYSGLVWNASASFIDDGINVNFYRSEACVESLTFKRKKKFWRLVAVAEECD